MSVNQESIDTAILFTGWHENTVGATDFGVSPLILPLMGRSILQRVVEKLVNEGGKKLNVILSDHPTAIRELLGDGARWGCDITYHYLTIDESFSNLMTKISVKPSQNYRIADANILPNNLNPNHYSQYANAYEGITDFYRPAIRDEWTGWGMFSGDWLLSQDNPCSREAIENRLLHDIHVHKNEVLEPIKVTKPADLILAGNKLLIDREVYETQISKKSEGITIGSRCNIHPNAELISPVYIASGVKVANGVVLGPNAIVGEGAYIDERAIITNASVLPFTYVGVDLELNNAVVSGPNLINTSMDRSMKIDDKSILSYMPKNAMDPISPLSFDKIVALILKISMFPLYCFMRLFIRSQHHKPSAVITISNKGSNEFIDILLNVSHPLSLGSSAQRICCHFVDTFFPGLTEVMKGHLKIVGPTIRSCEQVLQLDNEWQSLYRYSLCGLLQETLVLDSESFMLESLFVGDAIAANSQSAKADIKLVFRYLGKVVVGLIQIVTGSASKSEECHKH